MVDKMEQPPIDSAETLKPPETPESETGNEKAEEKEKEKVYDAASGEVKNLRTETNNQLKSLRPEALGAGIDDGETSQKIDSLIGEANTALEDLGSAMGREKATGDRPTEEEIKNKARAFKAAGAGMRAEMLEIVEKFARTFPIPDETQMQIAAANYPGWEGGDFMALLEEISQFDDEAKTTLSEFKKTDEEMRAFKEKRAKELEEGNKLKERNKAQIDEMLKLQQDYKSLTFHLGDLNNMTERQNTENAQVEELFKKISDQLKEVGIVEDVEKSQDLLQIINTEALKNPGMFEMKKKKIKKMIESYLDPNGKEKAAVAAIAESEEREKNISTTKNQLAEIEEKVKKSEITKTLLDEIIEKTDRPSNFKENAALAKLKYWIEDTKEGKIGK